MYVHTNLYTLIYGNYNSTIKFIKIKTDLVNKSLFISSQHT
jgi:hypothetical protein